MNNLKEIQDYMTSTQLERAKRHSEICEVYRSLTGEGLKPYGAMRVIGTRLNMTVPGVCRIIKAAGLYTPRSNGRNNKENNQSSARSESAAHAH